MSDGQHIAAVEAKVDRLEKKVDARFDKVDAGFAEMRRTIEASEARLRTEIISARSDARSDFRTLVALVVSLWAATVLTVLAAHL